MSDDRRPISDHEVEQLIGRLLQIGVLIAALVALIGGIMLLTTHGSTLADFRVFRAEPDALRSLGGIVRGAFSLDSTAVVQLGLLLLIMTPVARVAFTLVAFAIQRDRMYVLITFVVLALLLYGLIFGRA
jgi:uncharacterized membrane protein